MATGTIDVTPGSGEQIAFDKGVTLPGSVQGDLQLIKQVMGGDNDYTGYHSGRLVDGTTDESAAFVQERPELGRHASSLSVDTTPDYSSGDAITTGGSITTAVRATGGGLRIDGLIVVDGAAQAQPLDIVFFRDSISAPTNNSAFAPSLADLQKACGGISVLAADYATYGTRSLVSLTDVGLVIPSLVATTLYYQVIAKGTINFAASTDLMIIVHYTKL